MQGCISDSAAEIERLRGCLSAAETQMLNVQSAATARQTDVRGPVLFVPVYSHRADTECVALHRSAGGDRFPSDGRAGVVP